MNSILIERLIDRRQDAIDAERRKLQPSQALRVSNKSLAYSSRHRGQWTKPEYDFEELSIALDSDGYAVRAIQKKVNRIIVAGYDLVGANPETVEYVRRRISEMDWATQKPFEHVIEGIFLDLFRFNNHMLLKIRDSEKSSGKTRMHFGAELDPVAGYFPLPFETLEFKTTTSGSIKKVQQVMPNGERREFFPKDLVHFCTNKKPGFTVGTPEMMPALEDIALLRRLEENVEDLIEANLFPLFHYKIGTDSHPEKHYPDGTKESDIVKATIEYMPAGGIYISDHRTEITAIGSEGRALRIDEYLKYFKARALASLGASALDMGEGDTSNRSTASTLSKSMLMDIEAVAKYVSRTLDFYLINELLLEGGYDPLDAEQSVHLRFGIIDKDERRADENQQIQMFAANLRTIDEVRIALGDVPFEEEHLDRTHHKMFGEPLALTRNLGPDNAASEALANSPSSNVSPEGVRKEAKAAAATAAAKVQGRPVSKTNKTGANKSRPANQHGSRPSPKTTHDYSIVFTDGKVFSFSCQKELSADSIAAWKKYVEDRYNNLESNAVSKETLADSLLWRLNA